MYQVKQPLGRISQELLQFFARNVYECTATATTAAAAATTTNATAATTIDNKYYYLLLLSLASNCSSGKH